MQPAGWFLTAAERGNPATVLDSRHGDGLAWSAGNEVTPLVHGAVYFAELLRCVRRMGDGDLLLFTDWRGDPDERLAGPGTGVGAVLADAARRGVLVKGLIWRSHLDTFAFSAEQNRSLGDEVRAAGGAALLDMRVRIGGSHHQKFVVLRHPGRPELDVGFVGGIDLCHSRHDDARHRGDVQSQPIAAVYGTRAPWHDAQARVRGPAVGDLETVFRERWDDPAPLSRNPVNVLDARLHGDELHADPLPPQLPDPPPCGRQLVQLLRTYPDRLGPGYPFAPRGERSVARGYTKVLRRARELVSLEDQYLWSGSVARSFCDALRAHPRLRVVAVIPMHPDQDGRLSLPPNLVGRREAMDAMHAAGPGRVGVYCLENPASTPVYVHAKVCVVDDVWAAIGSDNVNRRSWTHDSELTCAVLDTEVDDRGPADVDRPDEGAGPGGDPARRFARALRLELAREHLDRADGDDADLVDPVAMADAYAASAAALDAWHDGGRVGPRPPGRLRTYRVPPQSRFTRAWAGVLYRGVYDPDGRHRADRRADRF